MNQKLDTYEMKVIALAAAVDYRTLQKMLRGEAIRPSLRHRILRELRLRRLEHLAPGALPLLVAS